MSKCLDITKLFSDFLKFFTVMMIISYLGDYITCQYAKAAVQIKPGFQEIMTKLTTQSLYIDHVIISW